MVVVRREEDRGKRVSGTDLPGRLSVAWLVEARTDLRGIDRGRVLEILYCLDPFLLVKNAVRSGLAVAKPPISDLI